MKFNSNASLFLMLSLAVGLAVSAAAPVVVQRQDIIGSWTDTACSHYHGSYEFRNDDTFDWSCADQVDGGKWLFRPPGRIELISWGDWTKPAITEKSVHHFIQIEGFAPHRMTIRLIPGGAKDVLVKK